jgi:steroid delta-isomerase-like uncharacterized protein
MSEQDKAITLRVFEEVWNQGNVDAIDELLSPDFVNHGGPPEIPSNREGFKQLVAMYTSAFPDVHFHIEDQIAEGDLVATRWSGHGTHQGELMGIPPTNKQVTVTGIVVDRIAGGAVAESWGEFDQMGMMQQLGVVPS